MRVRFSKDKAASEKSVKFAEDLLAEVRASARLIENDAVRSVAERATLLENPTQWEVSGVIDALKRIRGTYGRWNAAAAEAFVFEVCRAVERRQSGAKVTSADTVLALLALDAANAVAELAG